MYIILNHAYRFLVHIKLLILILNKESLVSVVLKNPVMLMRATWLFMKSIDYYSVWQTPRDKWPVIYRAEINNQNEAVTDTGNP